MIINPPLALLFYPVMGTTSHTEPRGQLFSNLEGVVTVW